MRAVLILALAAAIANAASISWTGIALDNQWTNHINWNPAQVPGENDDVTIPSGNVQVTIPTGVNSLSMGILVDQSANLTIFQAFVVGNGGMQVSENGNLIINTGLSQVFGQVSIGGTLNFIDGTLGGSWTVEDRASANLGNANEKGFSGCSFVSKGSLSLGGVIVLNQSSTFVIKSNTAANTNLVVQGIDGTAVSFDASAASFTYSTGTFTVQAPVLLGAFTLQSGNMSILDSITFQNSLNIPAGSYVAAVGNAVLNVSNGATGAGVLSVACQSASLSGLNMAGAVNFIGGTAIVASQSNMGILTVDGGNAVFMAPTYPAQFNVISGTSSGAGVVNAASLLINTKGFSLNSPIKVNKTATLQASTLSFGETASLTITADAKATVTGTFMLAGPPFVPGVTNNGEIIASAALATQNINIMGSGKITVASKMTVGTATLTQSTVTLASGASLSGSNTFLTLGAVASANGGLVTATFGDYILKCKAECDNITTPNSAAPTSKFSFSA